MNDLHTICMHSCMHDRAYIHTHAHTRQRGFASHPVLSHVLPVLLAGSKLISLQFGRSWINSWHHINHFRACWCGIIGYKPECHKWLGWFVMVTMFCIAVDWMNLFTHVSLLRTHVCVILQTKVQAVTFLMTLTHFLWVMPWFYLHGWGDLETQ